eukprot:4598147-Prymnesium_polylepis.1
MPLSLAGNGVHVRCGDHLAGEAKAGRERRRQRGGALAERGRLGARVCSPSLSAHTRATWPTTAADRTTERPNTEQR